MMIPPPNSFQQQVYAEYKIREMEQERILRQSLNNPSIQRNRLSNRAEALIGLLVVLLIIVGMLMWLHIIP